MAASRSINWVKIATIAALVWFAYNKRGNVPILNDFFDTVGFKRAPEQVSGDQSGTQSTYPKTIFDVAQRGLNRTPSASSNSNTRVSTPSPFITSYSLSDLKSTNIPNEYRRNILTVGALLDRVKDHFGGAIVNSGYREGDKGHGTGEAVDFYVPGYTTESGYWTVFNWIRDNLPFNQLIQEHNHLHLSYRRDGNNPHQLLQSDGPGSRHYTPVPISQRQQEANRAEATAVSKRIQGLLDSLPF